jgi:hypothetical protein
MRRQNGKVEGFWQSTTGIANFIDNQNYTSDCETADAKLDSDPWKPTGRKHLEQTQVQERRKRAKGKKPSKATETLKMTRKRKRPR